MFRHWGHCYIYHNRLLSCLFEVDRGGMTVVEDVTVSYTGLLTDLLVYTSTWSLTGRHKRFQNLVLQIFFATRSAVSNRTMRAILRWVLGYCLILEEFLAFSYLSIHGRFSLQKSLLIWTILEQTSLVESCNVVPIDRCKEGQVLATKPCALGEGPRKKKLNFFQKLFCKETNCVFRHEEKILFLKDRDYFRSVRYLFIIAKWTHGFRSREKTTKRDFAVRISQFGRIWRLSWRPIYESTSPMKWRVSTRCARSCARQTWTITSTGSMHSKRAKINGTFWISACGFRLFM